MKRIILSDTCLDLNDELRRKIDIKFIPLHLDLGSESILDGEDLNVREFVDKMHAYEGVPKTAAPSPQAFIEAMEGYDEVFIITVSSKLSTVYNSAIIAKELMVNDHPEMKIHVLDSKSASAGETLLAMKLQELIDKDLSFDEIVSRIEGEVEEMRTYFILENLDNLVKNGRMSKIAGRIASMLSINPVCKGNDGAIEIVSKSRGMKAGINKLVQQVVQGVDNPAKKTVVISNVLKPSRAEEIKNKLLEKCKFGNIEIVFSKGVTSIYANEGGIVVAL